MKKAAVIAYSGTVGKTTIVANLLAPRMQDARVFAVETINETAQGLGIDVEKLKGDHFQKLFKQLLLLDSAIIDVGASNVEVFLKNLSRFEGSHREIDAFIVPTTSGIKEQKEAAALVSMLSEIGVPPNKIRLLFNRVTDNVEGEFGLLLAYARKEKNCVANTKSFLEENDVFDMMATRKVTIADALADTTDYKSLLCNCEPKLRSRYTDMIMIKAGAMRLSRILDVLYKELIG